MQLRKKPHSPQKRVGTSSTNHTFLVMGTKLRMGKPKKTASENWKKKKKLLARPMPPTSKEGLPDNQQDLEKKSPSAPKWHITL